MANISDLTGIEAFIIYLSDGNQLTNIDLTQNTALTYLNCEDNQHKFGFKSEFFRYSLLWWQSTYF